MKDIELSCGLTIQVDENFLDDMEFVDCLAEADENSLTAMSKILVKLLGKDQRKKLYDALRKDGRVSTQAVSGVVLEIFEAFGGPAKNS